MWEVVAVVIFIAMIFGPCLAATDIIQGSDPEL